MSPEILRMVREVPSLAMAQLVPLQRGLLALTDEDDVRAFLMGVQLCLPGQPPILLAQVSGSKGLWSRPFSVSLGWSDAWLELYGSQTFHEVDPVFNGPVGEPIIWSELLLRRRSTDGRKMTSFRLACKRHGMTHGLSYIAERGENRVIVSVVGEAAEYDYYARQLLTMLLPSLADMAVRVLTRNARMANFTPRERQIFDCLTTQGLTQVEIADHLGLGLSTVKVHLKNMREAHGARTLAHLVHLLRTEDAA
ncbi:LuxR C-terminal-related transcriptional regulator [Chromobacterium vaccinii]|uniref:helix-turn-helix transcriptional regulator n=1 Tax=Chromobacterium vaccinii TaxID=1108595 RepID=UPI0032612EB3